MSSISLYFTNLMSPNIRRCLRALATVGVLGTFLTTASAPASSAPQPSTGGEVAVSKPAKSDLDPGPVAALARQVDEAEAQLDAISLHARSSGLSDAELRSRIAAIPAIQSKLADALDSLEPRLKSADARLAQLGPAPAAGAPPEDRETTQSRQEILRYRQSVDTEVKQARLLETEADQLNHYLGDRRRQLFSQRLWVRSHSMLDPTLWIASAHDTPAAVLKFKGVLDQEIALITTRAGSPFAAAIWVLAALLAAMLVVPIVLMLNRWGERRLSKASMTERSAATLATAWWIIVAGSISLMAGIAVQAIFSNAGALTSPFTQILSLLWRSVVFGILLEGVARALLAPRWPAWCGASFANVAAADLAPYPGLIATTAALAGLVTGLNSVLDFGSVTSEATGYLTLTAQMAVIVSGLGRIVRARAAKMTTVSREDRSSASLWWIVTAIVAWLTLVCAGAAIVVGYLALATLLVRELLWAAAIVSALFIAMRSVDAAIGLLLSPDGLLGRAMRLSIGLSVLGLEQIAEIISGLLRLGLLLAGWMAILAPLGADALDVFGRITSNDLILRFGQVTISPSAVVGALLVFGVGLAATHTFRSWLESRYLPKTQVDLDVRTSLTSGVTYVGFLVAFLLTCADLGLSLDRIALLASALTVGIGFGLQAIIGNFVSGLILLAERPVKVGDWIAIGDLDGDIRRINVRATEIEMGDRPRLIVPNSELVSKMVRNVTHGASLGRVKIVLSLDAKSDPLAARDLLLSRLKAHPGALADPPAAVYLTDIKDGAMEFTAFVYLPSPREAYKVKSELLFQIVPDLKAQGMAIATSNPVVHVDVGERPIEPASDQR